ncbi:hypothetical protein, partial [Corallococcus praedator]|uniref:hypothetical protein n=1 Tax=Corallococcus praedator TaxID=2316724 RepID=UPI0013150AA9
YFGAHGLDWLRRRIGAARVDRAARISAPFILTAIIIAVALIIPNAQTLVTASKNTPLQIYGAFASRNDLTAMLWLKDNTPVDTLILNHPGDHEGDWVPLITQRNAIFFRPQPFFQQTDMLEKQWAAFKTFWANPGAPENSALLKQY